MPLEQLSGHAENVHPRRYSMKTLPTIVVLGLLGACLGAQAADPYLGRNLAATCTNCHGTNGQAVPGTGLEALDGTDKATTLQKLAEFKNGIRPATIMQQIAKGYTDEQLALIAGYFAAQNKGKQP
jgi:cytochrome subunit of sulfide dehydrogenase